MMRVCGPTCPHSSVLAHENAAQGRKPLISKRIQVILASNGMPLGECRLRALMQKMVSNMIDLSNRPDLRTGVWFNEPQKWASQADCLTATTDLKSDFWRLTHYGFVRNSGHFLGFDAPTEFTAELRVRANYVNLYDQAGLMLRASDTQWLKTGVEFTDGHPMLSAVVTDGFSDWSVTLPQGDVSDLRIRVTFARQAVRIQTSFDGTFWPLLRLAPFRVESPLQVGPTLCTPERSGLEVAFSDFLILPASQKDIHDLT